MKTVLLLIINLLISNSCTNQTLNESQFSKLDLSFINVSSRETNLNQFIRLYSDLKEIKTVDYLYIENNIRFTPEFYHYKMKPKLDSIKDLSRLFKLSLILNSKNNLLPENTRQNQILQTGKPIIFKKFTINKNSYCKDSIFNFSKKMSEQAGFNDCSDILFLNLINKKFHNNTLLKTDICGNE